MTSKLFEPFDAKGLHFKNRIIHEPTTLNMSDPQGYATRRLAAAYGSLAAGGYGAVIVGATCVRRDGLINERMLGLYDEDYVIEFRDVVAEIKRITGTGARFALETSALPAVFREAVEALMPAGTCVLLGSARAGTEVSFDMPFAAGTWTSVTSGSASAGSLVRSQPWSREPNSAGSVRDSPGLAISE